MRQPSYWQKPTIPLVKPQPEVAVLQPPANKLKNVPGKKALEKVKAETSASSHQSFVQQLIPLIEAENERLLIRRQKVKQLLNRLNHGRVLTGQESKYIGQMSREYRVTGDPMLEVEARRALQAHIDVIPVSLTLAQAANESAWGESRFAKEGNNLFGIWTYDETKGIVPAERKAGARHLIRKFDSLAESVRYYMHTLNSHPAYADLRKIRAEQRSSKQPLDSMKLATGLTKYSAKGEEYVRLIQQLIERHAFSDLDKNRA